MGEQTISVDLTGRRAVVTGAASGIGRACAARLAQAGADVVIVDRNGDAAAAAAAEVGGSALTADLSDLAAVDELRLDADILVNNAGFQHVAAIPDFPPEIFGRLLRIMVE